MREIKFRGKRVETKEWVCGDLVMNCTAYAYIIDDRGFDRVIIPETVGQFTGLADKNNKEVYEGDIVKYGLLYYDSSIQPCIGTVVFENCSFGIENNTKNVNNCYLHQTIDYGDKLEVIGNIHENGDLLK